MGKYPQTPKPLSTEKHSFDPGLIFEILNEQPLQHRGKIYTLPVCSHIFTSEQNNVAAHLICMYPTHTHIHKQCVYYMTKTALRCRHLEFTLILLINLGKDGVHPHKSCSFSISISHLPSLPLCVHACTLGHVWLFVTPWTVVHQAPLSIRFPSQEYWSGLPFPPPEDLPDPRIKPASPVSPAWRRVLYHWATREAPLSLSAAPLFLPTRSNFVEC